MKEQNLNRLLILLAAVWVGLSASLLYKQIPLLKLHQQLGALENQIQQLQYENELLQIELARHTGLEYLDAQAARLGLIRPANIRFIQKNAPPRSKL
ncbi:MAG: septum formation initiator family protein [Candidatus Margulisbacteria bacterium]|jgi:cell division protein FtsL|nr:septum formation initiator family protein [Candidatus Margulisiibacteriota bacterium]